MEEKTLNIFDFDGTIFRSPVPNPANWDSSAIGKLKATIDTNGFGWFQDIVTLSEPYVPARAGEEWFVPHVKEAVLSSMKDENSITVLLTGRSIKYSEIVKNITYSAGITFDVLGFKPHDNEETITTMNFKKEFMKDLINNYNPKKVNVWEDRPSHVAKFKELFQKMFSHLDWKIIHVDPPGETFLTRELELELVKKLKETSKNQSELEVQVLYCGVELDTKSVELLKKHFPPVPGWTPIYHHMTISLGSLKNSPISAIHDVGSKVTLQVISVGQDRRAYAVGVTGYPSINTNPHVTLCIAPNCKPKDSNEIAEWRPLPEPLTISGKVEEFTKIFIKQTSRATKVQTNQKLNFGKLVVENTTRKGKQVSEAVKQLTEWIEAQKIENSTTNTKIVVDYILDNL